MADPEREKELISIDRILKDDRREVGSPRAYPPKLISIEY